MGHWMCTAALVSSCLNISIWALPMSSFLNCEMGSDSFLGRVDEGYTGIIDIMRGYRENFSISMEPRNYPSHLDYVYLNVTTGNETIAIVQTRKPLDREALIQSRGYLYYNIHCGSSGRNNFREVQVLDINDNAPVFEKDEYIANISETHKVGELVVKLKAVDADVTPSFAQFVYNALTPFPNAFTLREDGTIVLKEPLDYNSASSYTFSVEARDVGNLSSTTRVVVNVQDVDNLNPYFQHNLYQTNVEENWVGTVSTVQPAAVLALDGDRGINETLIYSLTSVSPTKYQNAFAIDPSTGVLKVVNTLNREEVNSLFLGIKAAQQDDELKTADSMILVDIEDVPEAPVFSSALYSSQIYSIAPYKYTVVEVKATDPDVGDTETLQYSLVEPSTAFAVEPSSGQVYVVSAAAESGKVTVRVKVEDRVGLHAIATVEITVLQSGSNNVAVLTLNKAAKTVEDSIPEVETSLGRALGWTVKVLSVTSNTSLFRREAAPTTLVNFLAMQLGSTQPISNEQINQRLETEGERVNQELSAVFGPGLEVGVGEGPTGGNLSTASQPTIITLGVLLGIFIALLPIAVVVTRKLAKRQHGVSLFPDTDDTMTRL